MQIKAAPSGHVVLTVRRWSGGLDKELPEIEAAIKQADEEYAEHLVGEHTDELARHGEQVRFSLNSAVVSLVTLFIDRVRRMYRHLGITIPRCKEEDL